MPSPQKIGSVAEIARLTGLSKASVNAALSGRGGNTRLSPETIQRVRDAAQQCNYRSNASARAVRLNRFQNIGFILVNKEAYDYAFLDIVTEGITSAAAEHGQNVFLIRVSTSSDFSQKLPRTLSEACLDGLIVQDAAQLTPEFVKIVESCGVPVVYLNDKRPTNAVYVDDVLTGRMMTEFLLRKGFRRITLLSPTVRVPHYSVAERIEGYRSAMEEAGLPAQVKRFPSPTWEAEATEWLKEGNLPEVVFCISDQAALVFQRVLYPLDLKVPRDLAIVSCNNEIMAAHSPIPLTTMHIPFPGMARLAVDMLMRLISEEATSLLSVSLKPELIERVSTASPFLTPNSTPPAP